MTARFFDKLLHDNEEDVDRATSLPEARVVSKHQRIEKKLLLIAVCIFLFALLARLYVLFIVTNPQNAGMEVWYSDVYHHWQIAYLSKEIGFNQGFLKLWDLKGMEYFWGLMHPLIGAILITITGSTNIVIFRLLSLFCGSLAITFLFLIVRRYWGMQAGLAAAAIAIFSPVGMFNDASGMVEPMGIAFMLGALYVYPRYPVIGGLLLAFGSMTRAEYWVLGGLVLIGIVAIKHHREVLLPFLITYSVVILIYMKFLLDKTGNPIYPVWWNFMGNAVGKWQADVQPSLVQMQIQVVYWGITAIALVGIIIAFWKRYKFTPFLLFGFGNWFLWGVVIGMTKYLLSYLPRFWVDRIMLWPYMFLGAIVSVLLFGFIAKAKSKKVSVPSSIVAWIVAACIIAAIQPLWSTIHLYYDDTQKYYDNFALIASEIKNADPHQGKILIPESWPPMTYLLVHDGGVKGSRLIGQMYDPFAYMGKEPFNNWGENRVVFMNWLKKENIRLMVFSASKTNYMDLIAREPDLFTLALYDEQRGLYLYYVNSINLTK